MCNNIRFVLVEPSHPGNIGAAARAMKNMGLNKLFLVNPKIFPHVDATARAAGADDILANATITNNLLEAITNCKLIIGTSARSRVISLPVIDPRQCAEQIAKHRQSDVAILFGRENNGLTNDEFNLCHFQLQIPTNPHFTSLNLASAVQLIAYEIFMTTIEKNHPETNKCQDLASIDEINNFFAHLEKVLNKINFFHPNNPKYIMQRLFRLFNRAQLEQKEINILRGILSKIEEKTQQ